MTYSILSKRCLFILSHWKNRGSPYIRAYTVSHAALTFGYHCCITCEVEAAALSNPRLSLYKEIFLAMLANASSKLLLACLLAGILDF
jgi:hypothetical protein